MRLQKVTGPPFELPGLMCLGGCGRPVIHGRRDRPTLYADLDGEPFKAYWCGPCAGKIRKSAALPVDFSKLPVPILPCCEKARGTTLAAVPSIRAGMDGGEAYGYVLESSVCGCRDRWVSHDWRKGHAVFVQLRSDPVAPAALEDGSGVTTT